MLILHNYTLPVDPNFEVSNGIVPFVGEVNQAMKSQGPSNSGRQNTAQ
jgi:hypothetical protein